MENIVFKLKFACEVPEDRFGCSTQNQQCRISPAEQRAQALAVLHSNQRGFGLSLSVPVGTCPAPGTYPSSCTAPCDW